MCRDVIRTFLSVATTWLVVMLLVIPGRAAAQTPELRQGIEAYQSGDMRTAIPALERALAADSLQPQAYVALASALLQTGRAHRAADVAATGLSHFPQTLPLLLIRAESRASIGEYGQALQVYEVLAEELEDSGAPSIPGVTREQIVARIGRMHHVLGGRAYAAGRQQDALRYFEQARLYLPDSASVYNNLAYLHLEQENYEAARRVVEEGLQRFPDDDRLLRLKSAVLHGEEDLEGLLPLYEDLTHRNPDDPTLWLAYAQVLAANQKHREALQVHEALPDRFPQNRQVHEALVDVHESALRIDEALDALRRMQQHFPGDPDVLRRIARLNATLERYDRARAVYDSLGALPGHHREARRAIAQTYVVQDSFDAAIDEYQGLLDETPDGPELLGQLGELYEEQGDWTDALRMYEQLAALDESAEAYVRLGRVHEALGQADEAFAAYRRASRQGADRPLPYVRLAIMLQERGRTEEAFDMSRRALRKGLLAREAARQALQGTLENQSATTLASPSQRLLNARREETIQSNRRLTEEALAHLTDHYPQERVGPALQDLLAEFPTSALLHALVGAYYRREGDLPQAETHLRRAVRLAPESRTFQLRLASFYEADGDTTKAIAAYERALAVDEETPEGYDALIRLYRAQDRLDVLIRRWQARYDATPFNDVLKEHLIEALHKAGKYEAARALSRDDS